MWNIIQLSWGRRGSYQDHKPDNATNAFASEAWRQMLPGICGDDVRELPDLEHEGSFLPKPKARSQPYAFFMRDFETVGSQYDDKLEEVGPRST